MTIDLRSDTVTKPSEQMMQAIMAAELGDDVYGEDPTVNELEQQAATICGKQSAIFCPTGTQSNLIAILSHCERGDEYIVGQHAHCYLYEAGGASVFGSVQSQPLIAETDGTLDFNKVRKLIKPDDAHFAKTKLLCLENTTAGKPLPLRYLNDIEKLKKETQLKIHLDGARLFNAVVKTNSSAQEICANFDSVSFCLSKGLGAPAGSLLCGDTDYIHHARRLRKALGGGMRQVGLLAAAGLYALQNNIQQLATDHHHAQLLTEQISNIEEVKVISTATNMVYIKIPESISQQLINNMRNKDILISIDYIDPSQIRLVIHLDIQERDIIQVGKEIKDFFASSTQALN